MSYRTTALVLAVAALGAAACSDSNNTTAPGNTARIRVVNASSGTASLNASSAGTPLATGLSFQNTNASAACVTVPAGTRTIDFSSTGSIGDVASVSSDFLAGQSYTVVLYGPSGAQHAVVLNDVFTAPSSGNNAIRFFNATGTAGDIYLTTPTGTVSGTPTVSNLAAGTATGATSGTAFATYADTNTRAQLFDVGTTTGSRADFTLGTMPSNGVTTVVLTPAMTTGGATGFMVNPCG